MIEHIKRVRFLLGDQTYRLVSLSLLFLLSSITELFSIGLIAPFIGVALSPDQLLEYPIWIEISKTLNIESNMEGVKLLGIFLALIFVIKSFFSYYVYKKIISFTFGHQHLLRTYLLDNYQSMPFEMIVNKNSSSMINTIVNHASIFTNSLVAVLRMIADSVVIIAVVSLLFFLNSNVTAVLITLFAFIFIIYQIFWKESVERSGDQLAIANNEIIRNANQAISGIKQIRVYGKDNYFLKRMSINALDGASASKRHYELQVIPRYFIECTLVMFVIGLTIIALSSGENAEYLLTTLSVFGVAALRIMPSFLVIVAGITTLYNTKYLVSEIFNDLSVFGNQKIKYKKLEVEEPIETNRLSFNKKIEVKNISFSYKDTPSKAIQDVSFEIEKYSSVGIIGSSGAGKTTIVDLILGLYQPQEGDILVDGKSIYNDPIAWMQNIAYIPQEAFLIDDSIEKNIALGQRSEEIDYAKMDSVIRSAQLEEFISNLDSGIKTVIGERGSRISGGQKQRVALARALYFDRNVIIMDEATAAIDQETEKEIVRAIKTLAGKVTLVTIAHRLSTIESCDVIFKFEKGKLMDSGKYNEIIGK